MEILVVEDERLIAFMISRYLTDLGHHVVACVPSGESALEFLRNNQVDFIFLDIRLEGKLDGIETAELIRETSPVPVAFSSAYVDETTRRRAEAVRPVTIIKKPLKREDLALALAPLRAT